MDMSLSKLRSWWWTGKPGGLHSVGFRGVVGGVRRSRLQLSNWTDTFQTKEHTWILGQWKEIAAPLQVESIAYAFQLKKKKKKKKTNTREAGCELFQVPRENVIT